MFVDIGASEQAVNIQSLLRTLRKTHLRSVVLQNRKEAISNYVCILAVRIAGNDGGLNDVLYVSELV